MFTIRKIFFDTETSGLDCTNCKIIELAMLVVEDGRIVEEYDEFINIGESISPKITDITGITNDTLVTEGINEENIAKDLKDRLSSGTLRKAYPHKLIDAVEHYDLEETNFHRAIADTKALYEVYNAMKDERDDFKEYVNVFGYNPRYGVNGVRFSFIEYKKHYFNNSMVSPNNILPRK